MSNNTLRGMISKALILASVLPILYLGGYLYESQTVSFKEEETLRSLNALNSTVAVVESFDGSNRNILRSFAFHPSIQAALQGNVNPSEITKAIYDYYNSFPSVDSIYLGASDGKHYSRKKALVSSAYDPRQRPWYKLAESDPGHVMVSEPYENAVAPGTYSITYSFTSSGTSKGVVGCDIRMAELSRMISAMALDKYSTVLVTAANGEVILCNDPKLYQKIPRIVKPTDQTEMNLNERKVIGGVTYRIYGKVEPKTGWHVFIYTSEQPLIEKQSQILYGVGILVFFMIMISLIATYAIVRFIMGHIDEFVEKIKRIHFEQIPERIETSKKLVKEFWVIRDTLDDMLVRIGKQSSELIQQKEEILSQYEEIEALYEQSESVNGILNDTILRLKESNTETIRALSNAIEAKDKYTLGHCERVTEYAVKLGKQMGLSEERLTDLEVASVLHDIGKVVTPLEILNKPGALTESEYDLVKQHPELGYQITCDLQFMKRASQIIRQHHERFDGTGFPQGLAGDAIDLEARILTIADAYDAMTSARAYRTVPLSTENALEELRACSGTQFDPELAKSFIEMMGSQAVEVAIVRV